MTMTICFECGAEFTHDLNACNQCGGQVLTVITDPDSSQVVQKRQTIMGYNDYVFYDGGY